MQHSILSPSTYFNDSNLNALLDPSIFSPSSNQLNDRIRALDTTEVFVERCHESSVFRSLVDDAETQSALDLYHELMYRSEEVKAIMMKT